MIETKNIHKNFSDLTVLNGVDLLVNKKEMNQIMKKGYITSTDLADYIVKDMVATKAYKSSLKDIEMLKNANNQDVAREYWTPGEEWVKYSMSDFINVTYSSQELIG